MTRSSPSELRALEVFDCVPPDYDSTPVYCGRNAPHLRPGEYAVFDPSDREPVHGECFVFEYSSGPPGISQVNLGLTNGIRQPDGSIGAEWLWWATPLNRPRGDETIDDWLRQRRQLYMSDGPLTARYLRTVIIGRVVGVYLGQFDETALRFVGSAVGSYR